MSGAVPLGLCRPPRSPLRARGRALSLDRPRIMGVVNVTPDSFSDGGCYLDHAAAVAHGERLLDDGADILDVGGASTRPGAAAVPSAEEAERVVPVIAALRRARPAAWISVDTTAPAVAAAALEAGADLINDVRGLADDDALAHLAAAHGAGLVLMHSSAPPDRMQRHTDYAAFPDDLVASLRGAIRRARAAGVAADALLVDPGFGFGKTWPQNVTLLRELGAFHALGAGLLVGMSRKAFLGWLSGREVPAERDAATHAAGLLAALSGAHVLRVHDVAGARDGLAVLRAVVGDHAPPLPVSRTSGQVA